MSNDLDSLSNSAQFWSRRSDARRVSGSCSLCGFIASWYWSTDASQLSSKFVIFRFTSNNWVYLCSWQMGKRLREVECQDS